jgi:hypothetical protein
MAAAAAAACTHLQLVQLLLDLWVMLEVAELEPAAAVRAGAALRVALLRVKPAENAGQGATGTLLHAAGFPASQAQLCACHWC